MLRFATLLLSNPAKPELQARTMRVQVTDGDFGLMVTQAVLDELKPEHVGYRQAVEVGESSSVRLMPYVGPLRVSLGEHDVFAGAVVGPQMAIGKAMVHELSIDGTNPTVVPDSMWNRTPQADKILVLDGAVSPDTCRKIIEYMASQDKRQASVLFPNGSQVDTKIRDVLIVNNILPIQKMLEDLLYGIFVNHIEPFFGVEIESWEMPQLMSYPPGGKYELHADNERHLKRPNGQYYWNRTMDRDISFLLYLNNDFDGGMLNFADLNIKVKPEAGLIVAFPSTAGYRHAAEPTMDGEKKVLVTWVLTKGTPRLNDTSKSPNRHQMHKYRKQGAKQD